jgi:hypothetical protein
MSNAILLADEFKKLYTKLAPEIKEDKAAHVYI